MAIVNGKSGQFVIETGNPYISGYVAWQETYDDQTYFNTNKTTVTIRAYLHRTNVYAGNTWVTNQKMTRVAYFDDETVSDTSVRSLTIQGSSSKGTPTSGGGPFLQVYTASKEITHDGSGAKTVTLGFMMTPLDVDTWTEADRAFSVAARYQPVTLTTIPRYLSITSLEIASRTETSAVVKWTTSDSRNSTYYSLDNGATWVGSATYGESLAADGKSGTFNILNLAAGTTYNLKVKFKRTDSGLWTESGNVQLGTLAYPYCINSPDFTIGDALKVSLYNPLGRNCTVTMLGNDGSTIYSGNGWTGTSVADFKSTDIVNKLYASIKNSQSGTYTIKVSYGSNVATKTGGTYKIRGTETPTVGSLSYADINSTVVAITGNNQHIVQNSSSLRVTFGVATARNSATISKYSFELNGVTKESTSAGGTVDFGAVNSASDLTLTMIVTDSRGLTAKTTKTITMFAHSEPRASVTLQRLNNYEDETYLTVEGYVSSVNGKNTMAIKYRYKVSGGSYNAYVTINNRQTHTLSLDKNNAYVFNVVVTDAFGSVSTNEYVLNKGMFPLFIDTEKNSVGVNCFPAHEYSLEVNGLDISTIYEFKKTLKLDANTWTNVGINYTDLETGTYIMQVILNNNSNSINGQFGERISGILSWYDLPTNSNNTDVIPVSKGGHARNNHNIQLRVARTLNTAEGYLRLQMSDDVAWNGEGEIVFKFKKLL